MRQEKRNKQQRLRNETSNTALKKEKQTRSVSKNENKQEMSQQT